MTLSILLLEEDCWSFELSTRRRGGSVDLAGYKEGLSLGLIDGWRQGYQGPIGG